MSQAEQIRALVAPVLGEEKLELVDCEVKPSLLRITVDRQGGIDADSLGRVSRRLSRLLDERDPIPGRYTLEVTSPGLERQLRTPEQFRHAVGSPVAVRTTGEAAAEGERRIQGTLESVDDDAVVVAGRRIPYDQIDRARTVFEWGPQPKPGQSKKKAAS